MWWQVGNGGGVLAFRARLRQRGNFSSVPSATGTGHSAGGHSDAGIGRSAGRHPGGTWTSTAGGGLRAAAAGAREGPPWQQCEGSGGRVLLLGGACTFNPASNPPMGRSHTTSDFCGVGCLATGTIGLCEVAGTLEDECRDQIVDIQAVLIRLVLTLCFAQGLGFSARLLQDEGVAGE